MAQTGQQGALPEGPCLPVVSLSPGVTVWAPVPQLLPTSPGKCQCNLLRAFSTQKH